MIDEILEYIGNYCICVDKGFPRSGALFEKFVGPISKKSRRKLAPMQGSFSRLKARLGSNKKKRGYILLSIFLLHNIYIYINIR